MQSLQQGEPPLVFSFSAMFGKAGVPEVVEPTKKLAEATVVKVHPSLESPL